jgi:hypothetical protein
MKSWLAALAALFILSAPTYAGMLINPYRYGVTATPTGQVLLTRPTAISGGGGVTRYMPLGYAYATGAAESHFSVVAAAGNLASMRFTVDIPPTGGNTWTIMVRKNLADTALTCTITAADSGVCTTSAGLALVPGDRLSLRTTSTGAPAGTFVSVSNVFEPTTPGDTLLFSYAPSISTSAAQAIMPFMPGAASIAFRRYSMMPDDGTVDRLYVYSNAPGTGGSGKSYDYSIYKNGAVTSPAITTNIADTSVSGNDVTNSFTVVGPSGATAGDDIEFVGSPNSTPTAAVAGFGARFRPTTAKFPLMVSNSVATGGATTELFYPMTGSSVSGTATEADVQTASDAMTITKLAAKYSAAPGALASGKSRTVILRKNGADAASCTVSENTLVNTCSINVSVAAGDLINYKETLTASPANAALSFVASANQ